MKLPNLNNHNTNYGRKQTSIQNTDECINLPLLLVKNFGNFIEVTIFGPYTYFKLVHNYLLHNVKHTLFTTKRHHIEEFVQ